MATISACMIVKDAEEHLERCLHSLQGIVEEIIVVDTGSTDNTLTIAKRYGAKTHHFSWNNDFSAARNASLEQATQDWILIIDDDEAFDRRELGLLKERLDTLEADAAIIHTKNFTNSRNLQGWTASTQVKGFDGYVVSKRVRLFRNNKGIRFHYNLHESVMPSLTAFHYKTVEITDVSVLHYGYEAHKEKYLDMAEKELEENDDDPKVLYEAGVAFLHQRMYDKAVDAFSKVRKMNPHYLQTLTNLGTAYTKQGKFYEAAQIFLEAIDRNKEDISAYNNLAVIFRKTKKYDKAEYLLKKALQIKKDPRLFYLLALVYQDQKDSEKKGKIVDLGLSYFPEDKQLLLLQKA